MIYTFRTETGTDYNPVSEHDYRDDKIAVNAARWYAKTYHMTITVFRGTERQVAAGNARRVGEVRE